MVYLISSEEMKVHIHLPTAPPHCGYVSVYVCCSEAQYSMTRALRRAVHRLEHGKGWSRPRRLAV